MPNLKTYLVIIDSNLPDEITKEELIKVIEAEFYIRGGVTIKEII